MEHVIFEQPLSEQIRICLRLEFYFQQLEASLQGDEPWQSQMAINTLIQLIVLTDRPDLKSKLLQMLKQCRTFYQQLYDTPHVDHKKLDQLVGQLDHYIDQLTQMEGRIAASLRDHELLNSLRLHATNPTGLTPYGLPEYNLWLYKSGTQRLQDVKQWSNAFSELQDMVCFLMKLIRQGGTGRKMVAETGFYQEQLDSNVAYQLVSVKVGKSLNVFPEISVGRHRISIHFKHLNSDRFQKTNYSIPFRLTYYRLN